MIYGSSVSSSSSSSSSSSASVGVGRLRPGETLPTTVGDIDDDENSDEGRPLLQYGQRRFWTPREAERAEFGTLDSSLSLRDSVPLLAHTAVDYDRARGGARERERGRERERERQPEGKMARFLKMLETDHEPGLSNAQLMLINHDLKPVEPARRTWGSWNFVGFWIADSFNINTWMISSSMIIAGLSWWQSWLCVWIGYFIAGCFICLTGRIGAVYHIGFPVVARSSFGIWGNLWPVFNRAGMACIWYGVQSWIGGSCVYLMLRSIWPSYKSLPNTMSESSGTNTRDYVSFFLFWFLSLPAIWFPVHQIRHLFTVKSYVVPIAGFAFFGWSIHKAGGLGPIVKQKHTAEGSALAWALVNGVMSSIANFATLIVNDPDFSRFAIKPSDALWSQLIAIPTGFAFTSFIGIIVSSSSSVIYSQPIWNPLELLGRFLDTGSSGDRAGVFFIALAFALAQLGTNIAANSISAGTDMTALLPRFINIRRGGYVCAAIGLAMCPWNLLSSSNKFTLYLSSYSVFLSSIAGVLISDYYFVRKGYLDIRALYSARKSGPYYYTYGVHWRAYAAYIAGILINVVGFVGEIGSAKVPLGATYLYRVNFFGGFIVSSGVYWGLCMAFPVPAVPDKWLEVGEEISDVVLAEGGEVGSMSVSTEMEMENEVVVDLEEGAGKKGEKTQGGRGTSGGQGGRGW